MGKRIKGVNGRENSVERWVARWANTKGQDYDNGALGALTDLTYGGCASGMVGELIYTYDVERFYKRHCQGIADILENFEQDTGAPLENRLDVPPLVFRAWAAVEIVAGNLLAEVEQ